MELSSRLLRSLVLLSLIQLPVTAEARTSRFDIDNLTLDIPCLEVVQDGVPFGGGDPVLYQVFMEFDGAKFAVTGLGELESADECLATFDVATNELVDQVRHQDNIFNVVLRHDGNLRFSAKSISFRERGTTSLWRVSNGVNTLFIGGTIHILNTDDFPLPDIFSEVVSQSDILVTEISRDNLEGEDNEAAKDLAQNPDGSLSEILLPSTLASLNEFLDQHGVKIDPIDDLLPYWAGRALIQLGLSAHGYGPGVDYFFQLVAHNIGMPNIGLETAVSQVEVVNVSVGDVGTPDEIILSAINAAQSDEYTLGLDFLIAAWREGNIEYFEYINEQQRAEDEEYYNLLLRDRNLAWIPQIEDMLTTAEVELILVGVGHLAGEDNVLMLLEDAGYKVERYR